MARRAPNSQEDAEKSRQHRVARRVTSGREGAEWPKTAMSDEWLWSDEWSGGRRVVGKPSSPEGV